MKKMAASLPPAAHAQAFLTSHLQPLQSWIIVIFLFFLNLFPFKEISFHCTSHLAAAFTKRPGLYLTSQQSRSILLL